MGPLSRARSLDFCLVPQPGEGAEVWWVGRGGCGLGCLGSFLVLDLAGWVLSLQTAAGPQQLQHNCGPGLEERTHSGGVFPRPQLNLDARDCCSQGNLISLPCSKDRTQVHWHLATLDPTLPPLFPHCEGTQASRLPDPLLSLSHPLFPPRESRSLGTQAPLLQPTRPNFSPRAGENPGVWVPFSNPCASPSWLETPGSQVSQRT